MSQQESRPPEFPRPSSTVAKNRLKSRLTFTSGKPQSASSALPKPRMQAGSQFSGKFIASNYGSRPPEVNASAWLEPADDQSTHTAPADEELDLLSVVLGGSEDKRISGQSSVFDSQIGVAGTVGHNSSFTSHNLLQKSHANMSSVLESEGHEHVVNSMVTGEAEFCYVDVDSENPFKFGITNVPKEIRENRFSTLSKNGLLRRLKDGDVEHVPLDRFIREHELYNKLMELTIFKQYRLWKCFSIWNRNIKQHKFMRYVSWS